jgi:peptidoglycan/xylan/chitin deacetylase (PgdA/CDA1 family)
MNIKQFVLRKCVAPALVALCIHKVWLRKRSNPCVLMFHGVTADRNGSVRHMATKEFRDLLILLKKDFELVSLDDLHSGNGNSSKPRAALTFDDGYRNNFTEAIPVLEELEIPATFFLISESLNNSAFTLPIDVIDCIINKYNPENISIDGLKFRRAGLTYVSEMNDDIYSYIIRNSHRMNSFSRELSEQFPFDFINDPEYGKLVRFIDAITLKRIAENPLFTFASHSATHINFITAPEEIVVSELHKSRRKIEELTGQPCKAIAYPYGLYNTFTRKVTREAGYTTAYAVKYQLEQDVNDQEIFQRIGISNTTTPHVNLLNICKLNKTFGV